MLVHERPSSVIAGTLMAWRSGKCERVIAKSVHALAERYDPTAVDPPLHARVRLAAGREAHDALLEPDGVRIVAAGGEPDALISGSPTAWRRAANGKGGLAALGGGGLRIRRNLHIAAGFLAATAGDRGARRLRLETVDTRHGPIATAQAGSGPPLLAIHGLGATKASFLPTLALMRDTHRVIAVDLPGFGDSVKPLRAPFDAPYFAGVITAVLDELGIERAHVVGNSMGGRIALELALTASGHVEKLVLLSPAMAWLRPRRWAPVVRLLRPELTMVPMPVEGLVRRLVPGGDRGWAAAGVDEFMRAFSTARGRHAFHAAARSIYLDRPHGDDGLWSRLEAMTHESLFVWGRRDRLVPIGFMKHVERTFPAARHLELDCGHVPQVERPRETHRAMRAFLS
jgi:pimeloyl-ACP methyl ester carboxylesterase